LAPPPHHRSPLSLHDALPIWERTAVAAREPDLPLLRRCRVRALVRPRVPGETALRHPHADLHGTDPAPRAVHGRGPPRRGGVRVDRKSTRLNSSHQIISYAVF